MNQGGIKMEKEFLTVKDIQDKLSLTRSTAYTLVNSEVFPVLRVGKVIRIPRKTFEEWLAQAVC